MSIVNQSPFLKYTIFFRVKQNKLYNNEYKGKHFLKRIFLFLISLLKKGVSFLTFNFEKYFQIFSKGRPCPISVGTLFKAF